MFEAVSSVVVDLAAGMFRSENSFLAELPTKWIPACEIYQRRKDADH